MAAAKQPGPWDVPPQLLSDISSSSISRRGRSCPFAQQAASSGQGLLSDGLSDPLVLKITAPRQPLF